MSEEESLLDIALGRQTSEIFQPDYHKRALNLGEIALTGNWQEGDRLPSTEELGKEAVGNLETWFGVEGEIVDYIESIDSSLPPVPVLRVGEDLITYDGSYNNGRKNGFSFTTVEKDQYGNLKYKVFHRPFNDAASYLAAYSDYESKLGRRYTSKP